MSLGNQIKNYDFLTILVRYPDIIIEPNGQTMPKKTKSNSITIHLRPSAGCQKSSGKTNFVAPPRDCKSSMLQY